MFVVARTDRALSFVLEDTSWYDNLECFSAAVDRSSKVSPYLDSCCLGISRPAAARPKR